MVRRYAEATSPLKRNIPFLPSSDVRIFGEIISGRRVQFAYRGSVPLIKGREIYIETDEGTFRATIGDKTRYHHLNRVS